MFDSISKKFSNIMRTINGTSKISERNIREAVEEIKIALLDADVNLRVVRRFINYTREEALGEKVLNSVNPGQQFTKLVYDRMVKLLGDEDQKLELKGPDTTTTIVMMGLQGSGKTTCSAKLALKLKKEGRRPLLCACDLVRPAAIDQLEILANSIDVPVFLDRGTKDAKDVASRALAYAKTNQYDTLIVDTSGRMYIDDELMNELKGIVGAVKADNTLFVADSMTGQKAVDIAKEFESLIGITAVVLTKFDGDTRGGAALSLKSVVGKPLLYVGVGEKVEDLEVFHPERMASRILGMGDVVSLVEKAQETIDEEEAEKLSQKMKKNTFDLQDYSDQISRMTKMGSMQNIIDMIPGAKGQISEDDINMKEFLKEQAIISSMTIHERQNRLIIGPSRRKRIAKGSGTTVYDVNRLLKKFDKMRLTMRKVARNKNLQADMLKQLGMEG